MVDLKVQAPSKKEEEKLGIALRKLTMEDPSFKVHVDEETNETIISGMGELHLEIIVDRLKHEFSVEATVGEPSVAYRETITTESTQNTKFSKQTGGRGQYAHCEMRIEPNPGKGFEFVDHIKGGVIPQEYIPAIQKGIVKTMDDGVIADFPVVDVRVVLLDGSYHEVDSSEMAFRTCASMCFKDAFRKAHPILLEPLMEVEVNTPDEHIGDVVGDLNRRRGRVESMRRFRKGAQKINGFVPLSEMFGYANQLRNITSGRANYSMEFSRYVPVNKELQEKVIKRVQEQKAAKV